MVNFAASSPHDDGERWDSTVSVDTLEALIALRVQVPKLLYDSRPGREWIMLPPSLPSSCSTKEGEVLLLGSILGLGIIRSTERELP